MGPDEQLEALRRDLEADPKDVKRRSRFLGALVRAGQGQRARNLIRDGFLCPWTWEDFQDIGKPGLRFCDDCQEEVHLALDKDELAAHAAQGRCVTAGADVVLAYADEQIARVQSGHEPDAPPPCLSEHKLKTYEPRPGTKVFFDPGIPLGGNFIRARRILPVERIGERLVLGLAEPPSQGLEDDIRLMMAGVPYELVLVERRALEHRIDMLYPDFDTDMLAGLMMEEV